jgi:hypothetical protein
VDLRKGNDVLTLEALAGSHTLLVGRLESPFSQMLDEGDEDILWVVLFEGDVRVGGALGLFSLRGWWVLRVVLVASELGAHLCELSHQVHAVT